jgi:anti-anti-sigma factor
VNDTRTAAAPAHLRIVRAQTEPGALQLYGELDVATKDLLLNAVRRGSTAPLRVDATGVTFVDCAGLGSLVELAAETRASGRAFEISAASRPLTRLTELTGLTDVLGIPPPAA